MLDKPQRVGTSPPLIGGYRNEILITRNVRLEQKKVIARQKNGDPGAQTRVSMFHVSQEETRLAHTLPGVTPEDIGYQPISFSDKAVQYVFSLSMDLMEIKDSRSCVK